MGNDHTLGHGGCVPSTLVSVVVAAHNAAATISSCVDSILAQTYQPLELIVVDDGSTDATPRLLQEHPRRDEFTVLRLANGGPSRARNHGCAVARGNVLAFFDSDCRVDARCVEELVGALGDPLAASVGGSQLSPHDDTAFGRDVQRYFEAVGFMTGYVQPSPRGEVVRTSHNPSCNVLYRREALARLGGFDESLWPGEDVDLDRRASRLGYFHLFNPRAVIYHYRPASLAALRRMFVSYGRAQMALVRRYGPFRRLQVAGLSGAAGLVLVPVAWILAPRATTLALAAGGALLACWWAFLRLRGRGSARFGTFVWINVCCWFQGFLGELVRPRVPRRPTPGRVSLAAAGSGGVGTAGAPNRESRGDP